MKIKSYISIVMACMAVTTGIMGCGTKDESALKNVVKENIPIDENGNPSPFGKYKEPITVEIVQSINPTMTIPEGQSTTDNQYTRYIKDNINIDINVKWQASTADYSQKLNLAIASNDLPDIMVVGENEFKKLIKSDQIEDLTPYYDQFISDTIRQNIESTDGKSMAAATVDGKMYGLPSVNTEADGYSLMWIRKDWLDKLGLEVPKTVDELETVAKAFVDNKMGGDRTVGILGPTVNNRLYGDFLQASNNLCTLDGIFQAYQSYPGFWIKGEDGKAVYGSTTAETKEALGKLQEMYKNGALDQELGVRKDADEAWKSGQAGIFFYPWWLGYNLAEAIANDPDATWVAYAAPEAKDGQWYPKLGSPTNQYVVVRKGYEHPEAAFLLNNFLRRDEAKMDVKSLDASYYPGRIVITPMDENSFTMQVLRKYLKGEEIPEYDNIAYKLLDNDIATVKDVKQVPYDDFDVHTWNMSDVNSGRIYSLLVGSGAVADAEEAGVVNKVYSLIYTQTPTMEKKWTNLKKKEDEIFMKIIIGEEPVDSFDTFVKEWKAEGGDEITAEVQEAANQ